MTEFTIGAEASCTDGVCGEVTRVVVDPVARAVTHLVVEPEHRVGLARLVPLDLVDAAAGQIRLRCTIAEFERLGSAEETQFVPGSSGYAAYGPDQVVSWPYYGLAATPDIDPEVVNASPVVTYDTIPWARWRCAAATPSMPPMATSGGSRDSSSTRAATT
jgi:hypothetical protein